MDALTDRPSGVGFDRDPQAPAWGRLLAGTGFFAVQLVATAVAVGAVSSSAWAGAVGVLLLLLSAAVAVAFVIIRSLARELRETSRQLQRLKEGPVPEERPARSLAQRDPGRPGLPGHPLGPVSVHALGGATRYGPALGTSEPDRRRPPVPTQGPSEGPATGDEAPWVRGRTVHELLAPGGDHGR